MKITKPKKQLFNTSTTFYVSSESGGDKHIVVRKDSTYFCDCKDFMTRKLPLYGTNVFSLCKHGGFVRDNSAPASKEPVLGPKTPLETPRTVKQFGVFFNQFGLCKDKPISMCRSNDIPETFSTRGEAQTAIDKAGTLVEYTIWEISPPKLLKQFAVFAIWRDGSVHRSADITGVFGNRKAAQFALDEFYKTHSPSFTKREVRECQS